MKFYSFSESEEDHEEMSNSERSETVQKFNIKNQNAIPIEYESLSAICYQKFKFSLLARNVFSSGLLPFLSCLLTDFPTEVEEGGLVGMNVGCKIFSESLKYNIYILELPFLWENLKFEKAVKKIDELENHPIFVSTYTKLKLIGLVEEGLNNSTIQENYNESKNLYAPFGKIIGRSNHKGIYLCNNEKIK